MIFRRPGAQVLRALGPGVVALVGLIGVVSPDANWWGRIIFGFLAACAAPVTVRIGQLGLIAEPRQLVIRNFRNTHRVSWSQIVDISQPPLGVNSKDLLISLAEGAVISVTLYSGYFTKPGSRNHVIRTGVITSLKELQGQRARLASAQCDI